MCDRTVRRLLLVESPHDPTRTMSSPTPRTALCARHFGRSAGAASHADPSPRKWKREGLRRRDSEEWEQMVRRTF